MYPFTPLRTLRLATTLLLGFLPQALSTFRIAATAPVNPIEYNGILSLHCQVWDLPKQNEVRIFRTIQNHDTERISLDEVVIMEDERVFLAKRQVEGGSFVYFMTIIDVKREDGGEYVCKVFNTSGGKVLEIGADSVRMGIVYFPSESDPACSMSQEGFEFYAGTQVTMRCTSEKANPEVLLQWARTSGTDGVYDTEQRSNGANTYTELSVTLQKHHSSSIFLCTVSSRAFPGRLATCHIGPIRVISNPNDITTDLPDDNNDKINNPDSIDTLTPTDTPDYSRPGVHIPEPGVKTKDCDAVCSTSPAVFQWIVTTVITAGIAFIFFIIGIALIIRYNSVRTFRRSADHQFGGNATRTERIYSELDQKQQENASYMYLQCKRPSNHDVIVREMPGHTGHYDGNQNMGKS